MKNLAGFTLIELLITVAIAAVLLGIGVPSFLDLIQNNRVASQANELVAVLNYGRGEAVKRGRQVEVVVTAGVPSGWTGRARLVGVAAPDDLLREVDRGASAVVINAGTVVFGPTGAQVPPNAANFVMQPANCAAGKQFRRVITLSPTGHVRIAPAACA